MSKFHNYSANNIQLITMQCPDATFVAGRMAWENEFNRQVNRGEKGIRILAPAPYTIKKEQDKVDPVTGEIMMDKSLLLIQDRDLTQYSLLSVSGMEAAELVEALSAMKDYDRLDIAEYLDNMGAWTTEIANERTREFGEYHLDVRYYTDANEVINLKAEMEFNERAKEPIGADDVILKIAFADGFEVERITRNVPTRAPPGCSRIRPLRRSIASKRHSRG